MTLPGKHKSIFTKIYQSCGWNGVGSGPGSQIGSTTLYRQLLERILHGNGIRRVVDLGCGDWQFSRLIDWTGVKYLGIDIVPKLIALNKANHSKNNVCFECGDIRTLSLPDADIYIIKDVLQHWPNSDIISFLSRTSTKPMLITNSVFGAPGSTNCDIPLGWFRPLDLLVHPFNIPGARVVLKYEILPAYDVKQVLLVNLDCNVASLCLTTLFREGGNLTLDT